VSSRLDSRVPAGGGAAVLPPAAVTTTPPPRWRAALAPPVVALVTLVVALVATDAADIRFRDPDNVAAGYVGLVGAAVALLVWLDIAIRAARATGTRRPSRAAMREVRRRRWTRERMLAAAGALLSFYVSYLAYRNLKAVLPFLRPGELFDRELAEVDRLLFAGNDPAALLHGLLGIGLPTHVLSTIYAAFIVFLPLSLAVALVFSPDLPTSLFFATALSLNWLIGAGSYFLLPALGPVYADPGAFASLPYSEVTRLQQMLLDDRIGFLRDPETGTPQAIAAFASLHIAMSFTSLVAAHLLGLGRRLKIALWIWLIGTCIATIYLGWHYVVDDLAGFVIGAVSLALARVLTQYDLGAARRARQRGRALAGAPA
jgi:membrane-associated phospholipid phosphatase